MLHVKHMSFLKIFPLFYFELESFIFPQHLGIQNTLKFWTQSCSVNS